MIERLIDEREHGTMPIGVARVFAVVVSLLVFGVARADKTADARQHYLSGAKAYEEGEFQRAVDEYRVSYDLSRKALLLYDLGQAYRKLGNNELSLHSYKQFLVRSQEAREQEYRDIARVQVEQLEVLVAEQQKAKAAAPDGVTNPDTEKVAQPPRVGVPSPPPPAPVVSAVARQSVVAAPSPEPRGRSLRLAGISLIAGGGVMLVLGGVFVALAKSANDDATASGTYNPGAADRRDAFQIVEAVMFSVGAGTLVSGNALFLVGRHRQTARRLVVLPSMGVGHVGGTIGFRF